MAHDDLPCPKCRAGIAVFLNLGNNLKKVGAPIRCCTDFPLSPARPDRATQGCDPSAALEVGASGSSNAPATYRLVQ